MSGNNQRVGDPVRVPLSQVLMALDPDGRLNRAAGDFESVNDILGDIFDDEPSIILPYGDASIKIKKESLAKTLNSGGSKVDGNYAKLKNSEVSVSNSVPIVECDNVVLEYHRIATNSCLRKSIEQTLKNSVTGTPGQPIPVTQTVAGGTVTVTLAHGAITGKRQFSVIYLYIGKKFMVSSSSSIYTIDIVGKTKEGATISNVDTRFIIRSTSMSDTGWMRVVIGYVDSGVYNPVIAQVDSADVASDLSITMTGGPDGETLTVMFPSPTHIPFAKFLKDFKIMSD